MKRSVLLRYLSLVVVVWVILVVSRIASAPGDAHRAAPGTHAPADAEHHDHRAIDDVNSVVGDDMMAGNKFAAHEQHHGHANDGHHDDIHPHHHGDGDVEHDHAQQDDDAKRDAADHVAAAAPFDLTPGKARAHSFTHLDEARRATVRAALAHSWAGYKAHAFGFDEYSPMSKHVSNWGHGRGVGCTIIDALDTLLLANLTDASADALAWVEGKLSFDQNAKLSVFETTIRILGGLVSGYQLTGRKALLAKAVDLGDRLLPAFDTASGFPDNYVHLQTHHHEGAHWNGGAAILSEFGSLQMEFLSLSKESHDEKYWAKARLAIEKLQPHCGSGLCPRNFQNGRGAGANAGLGSFGDSFYEYLLKTWLLSGKTDALFKAMWDKAAAHIIATSTVQGGFTVPNGAETGNVMEHLACFSGGLFALSYITTGDQKHLEFGEKIAATCHHMYQSTATKLSPDVARIGSGGAVSGTDMKYILRPETAETYFYLWRATHDEKYREWGYEIMTAIDAHLKVDGGYVGILNVNAKGGGRNDNMETFWFAETLKYLYMLFSEDELIDLHEWVFNTEAHPMKVQHA
jgi:mannosyl-oligosaccharide alpha-1,2-mannosidase